MKSSVLSARHQPSPELEVNMEQCRDVLKWFPRKIRPDSYEIGYRVIISFLCHVHDETARRTNKYYL